MSENENVAFKAFHRAAELFDKCIGMTWFNISVCNQKNYQKSGGVQERRVAKAKRKCTISFN